MEFGLILFPAPFPVYRPCGLHELHHVSSSRMQNNQPSRYKSRLCDLGNLIQRQLQRLQVNQKTANAIQIFFSLCRKNNSQKSACYTLE